MKVTYIGDDKQPPQKTSVFGYVFELGIAIDIEDKNVLTKLRKHKCFKVGRNKSTKEEDDSQEIDPESLTNNELRDIIIQNGLFLPDKKKSTAVKVVSDFLKGK